MYITTGRKRSREKAVTEEHHKQITPVKMVQMTSIAGGADR